MDVSRVIVLVAGVALASGVSASATDEAAPGSIAREYNDTLAVMAALPRPVSVDFVTDVRASGVGIRLDAEHKPAAVLLGFGGEYRPSVTWQTAFTTAGESAAVQADGQSLTSTSPLFNPTWDGAYSWLRYGLAGNAFASPAGSAPPSRPSSPETSAPSAPDGAGRESLLQTIGAVRALSTAYYQVTDAGPGACPDGSAGTHWHLVAWRDAAKHPLTDVVVDASTHRFCSMRFNLGASSAFSLTGSWELFFGDVAGYWMVTSGTGNFNFRVLGLSAKKAQVTFVYRSVVAAPAPGHT